jgi:hypothetical protein
MGAAEIYELNGEDDLLTETMRRYVYLCNYLFRFDGSTGRVSQIAATEMCARRRARPEASIL